MAEQIFRLTHNQQPIQPSFSVIAPGDITGEIIPKEDWPETAANAVSATLDVFETPLNTFINLGDELHQREDQVVRLSEVNTRIMSADSIALEVNLGYLYDIFCAAQRADGTKAMFGGARFAVTDDEDFKIDNMLTFDEAKYFGYIALGLGAIRPTLIEAKVRPMSAWGDTLPGRFVIAGFDLSDGSSNASERPGIMVDHFGRVNFYHGRTAAETIKLAGLSR